MRSPLGGLLNRSPVQYSAQRNSFSSIGMTGPSGAVQQMAAMGSVGTLFSIVTRLAYATSQQDWELYRTTTDARRVYEGQVQRIQVTKHAALDVLANPNPFMTRQELFEVTQQHLDLTGEGWWVIGRDPRSSLPLELWPVRPDRMQPVPHPTEYLAGYVYTSPNGEKVPLGLDDVIFMRSPNPLDPYRGMGPVQTILTDLDSAQYSAEWNRNFFLNGAEPGGIIEASAQLGDDEFERLQLQWSEQHRGVANAHRVAILEAGSHWVDRSTSPKDMQFVELRSVSREIIREAFGIHKHMLGLADDVNRANAEAASVDYARWQIVPRLERIKGALNSDFLPMFGATGQGIEFDYCNPVPEDQEAENAELTAKSNAVVALVNAGFDPTAVLQAIGLPDMPFREPSTPPVGASA